VWYRRSSAMGLSIDGPRRSSDAAQKHLRQALPVPGRSGSGRIQQSSAEHAHTVCHTGYVRRRVVAFWKAKSLDEEDEAGLKHRYCKKLRGNGTGRRGSGLPARPAIPGHAGRSGRVRNVGGSPALVSLSGAPSPRLHSTRRARARRRRHPARRRAHILRPARFLSSSFPCSYRAVLLSSCRLAPFSRLSTLLSSSLQPLVTYGLHTVLWCRR
jgi:hypothetical protein